MIEPITGAGVHRARVICDDCGRNDVVTCDYSSGRRRQASPHVGQIHKKITGQGWSIIKGHMFCPGCTASRRAALAAAGRHGLAVIAEYEAANRGSNAEDIGMAETAVKGVAADLRRPSREQKRQIMGLLESVYDVAGQRYRGADTDKTVAEVVGDGVLPGWVAELRDEFFGPAGENEEMAGLQAVVEALRGRCDELERAIAENAQTLRAAVEVADRLATDAVDLRNTSCDVLRRLAAIKKAVGPKAERV